jgi:hypothetical protein
LISSALRPAVIDIGHVLHVGGFVNGRAGMSSSTVVKRLARASGPREPPSI